MGTDDFHGGLVNGGLVNGLLKIGEPPQGMVGLND